ncbi:hypothetical protein RvY_09011-1 [Ramazzottius varieornatus]|uniref:Transmembrane protein 216 n=1 Tax=Ramazzottius varieornatus TaxID=947166 RepID=A0A1D1V7Z7_RAMVA|nr:hypothetical protein RvY_09011-1 [Ramazzottius varieornatus]
MAIFDASSPKFTKKIYTSNSQKNVAVILAILFMLNIFYDIAFIIGEIVLFIQKGTQLRLPYSADDIGLDTVLLLLLVILDALRFSFGKKGYLTQRLSPLFLCTILTPAVLLIGIHTMLWQTFVTRADYILGSILIAFHAAELVFLLLAILICMTRQT